MTGETVVNLATTGPDTRRGAWIARRGRRYPRAPICGGGESVPNLANPFPLRVGRGRGPAGLGHRRRQLPRKRRRLATGVGDRDVADRVRRLWEHLWRARGHEPVAAGLWRSEPHRG